MEFAAYKKLVGSVQVGKKLPDAVYLHKSYLESAPPELASFVGTIVSKYGSKMDWNVVKLFRRDFKISLLIYPGFDHDSYPRLNASLTIDLVRSNVRLTSFSESDNPPILHRKETMVSSNYPLYEHFATLTQDGEKAGLYENSQRIGFKKSWERIIACPSSNKWNRLSVQLR